MEKINQGHPMSQSPDFVKENIELLKSLFPTIVKEGKIVMEELEVLLGEDVEKEEEYYNFTWAGKSMARREANKPSTATLRPDKSESKDWDTTGNIFIEGDNLEVLKLLQKSYANKVKMIYIDPPYNTGKDFVYKDNYSDNLTNYLSITGQSDEEGKRLSTNSESDGRYHSNWLNMIYPRLKLARNLLTDDGAIFISIDDNEIENLKKLCNEIFGESNFISNSIVVNNPRGRQSDTFIASTHEYLLIFSKNISRAKLNGKPLTQDQVSEFNFEDENGEKYRLLGLRQRGAASRREDRPDMFFPIYVNPTNGDISLMKNESWYEVLPKKSDGSEGRWMWGKSKCETDSNLLVSKLIDRRNEYDIFVKDYLNKSGAERTRKFKSIWDSKSYNNQFGTQEVKSIFNADVMSFPKSRNLIEDICLMGSDKDSIILDFFSGSGTTAHACMTLNSIDKGLRKFIMIQLPEIFDSKSIAFKSGFKTLSDIGKERIRRAGEGIILEMKKELSQLKNKSPMILTENDESRIIDLEESISNLDVGFKAFKLDSSNIKSWDGNPDKLEETLFSSGKNIKEERGEEDVLFEILLKYGLDLTVPIEEKSVKGKVVYSVGYGTLFICLSDNISTEVAEAIGQWKEELEPPTSRVIFKDSGFNDVQKTNSIQILK
jgi:adenine-specific DNA-methyltransferase